MTIYIIITIFISFLIIFTAYNYLDHNKIEETENNEILPKIDDRISPLTNQILTIEILRIRHRGLLNELMKPGIGWRNKPEFYFTTDIDGEFSTSKDIETTTLTGSMTYKKWDTMFDQNKVVHDAEEEQETSDIELTLVEVVKTGIFKKKINDIERDKINIKYDYRTGRWEGDDSFGDYDGYGHYVGNTFEIWFNIYQDDFDMDGIPFWTEINVLGTDPKRNDKFNDPDMDGIDTFWEWKWGYDPMIWNDHELLDPDIDGIENIEEYKMYKYLSNPFHQDIYIEIDGMVSTSLGDLISPHKYYEESGQAIIERFCQHNICMYIDSFGWHDGPINGGGEVLPHIEIMSDTMGHLFSFYRDNFADERKGIFRYVVLCHAAGFTYIAEYNKYDAIAVGTNLKRMWSIFGVKHAYTPRMYRFVQAVGVMHELGHTIGLVGQYFEGVDHDWDRSKGITKNEYDKTWGQYYSVMSYYNMYKRDLLDYSNGSGNDQYDQADWLHIFIPRFQTQDLAVESATFDGPIVDELGSIGRLEYGMEEWNYSLELTEKINSSLTDWLPIYPINCNWRVYYKENCSDNISYNLRVYAIPLISPTPAEYVLIDEGKLTDNKSMIFNLYLNKKI
jgi:hypothetical protein